MIEKPIEPAQADVGYTWTICPVCESACSRDGMALYAHLSAHVRRKLITKARRKELLAVLCVRRRKPNTRQNKYCKGVAGDRYSKHVDAFVTV